MVIEKENALSSANLNNILKLVKDFNFPWFYRPSTLNNFPYNSHALLDPALGITYIMIILKKFLIDYAKHIILK